MSSEEYESTQDTNEEQKFTKKDIIKQKQKNIKKSGKIDKNKNKKNIKTKKRIPKNNKYNQYASDSILIDINGNKTKKKSTESIEIETRIDDILDVLLKCAQEEANFDIYQICAFRAKNGNGSEFAITVMKALLCSVLQATLVAALMWELRGDGLKSVCEINAQFQSKIIAILITVFICVYSYAWREKVNTEGFYYLEIGKDYVPEWINHYWIVYGWVINFLLCAEIIFGSAYIVYVTDNILDIVLNSVALFFIADMDNMVVPAKDYRMIEKFIESGEAKRKYGTSFPRTLWKGYWMRYLERFIMFVSLAIFLGVFALPLWIFICK